MKFLFIFVCSKIRDMRRIRAAFTDDIPRKGLDQNNGRPACRIQNRPHLIESILEYGSGCGLQVATDVKTTADFRGSARNTELVGTHVGQIRPDVNHKHVAVF
jgi:hypothetical protein